MNNRVHGIIGMGIPFVALIGFILFFFVFSPYAWQDFEKLSLSVYNIKNIEGQTWMSLFTYGFVGILLIAFSFGIVLNHGGSKFVKIGGISLLLASISWFSFGIIEITGEREIASALIRTVIFHCLIVLGFLLIMADMDKVNKHKTYMWSLLAIPALLIALGITEVSLLDHDYDALILAPWILEFLGMGFIGHAYYSSTLADVKAH